MTCYFKFLIFLCLVLVFFLTAAIVHLASLGAGDDLRFIKIRVSKFYNHVLVKILELDICYVGQVLAPKKNYLFVANHLSYLDVVVLSSLFPACFITSIEMRHAAFLGWICRATGCLFVERRSRDNLDGEVAEIASQLARNNNVMLFPEGTTSNGGSVLRFRRPLFQSAIDAARSVVVLTINYRTIDAEPVTIGNRDRIFWYGKMTFFDHFLAVLKMRSIEVEVSMMGIIEPGLYTTGHDLAAAAHSLAESGFIGVR